MEHKSKKFSHLPKKTLAQCVNFKSSNFFLINALVNNRKRRASVSLRAALGIVNSRANISLLADKKKLIYAKICVLSHRSRGIQNRYSLARSQIKHFSSKNILVGARKSS
jgi:hypothetical protein